MNLRDQIDALDEKKTAADWCAWFESVEHTAPEMRIIMSGLKPEAGAWERSKLRLEIRLGEWFLPPEEIAARKLKLAHTRYRNDLARVGMPTRRAPLADGHRPVSADKQPPAQPSWWTEFVSS